MTKKGGRKPTFFKTKYISHHFQSNAFSDIVFCRVEGGNDTEIDQLGASTE